MVLLPLMQLIYADNTSLDEWRQGNLTFLAEEILSQPGQGTDAHRLANRAVVKARLLQWDLAENDARMVPPYCSFFAYVLIPILLSQSRLSLQFWVISQ